jgi:type 1 glutamine amidotransferase
LVLCDDYWHPASVVRAGLEGLTESGYEFDWIENADAWLAERMAEYPVVLLSKSDNVSADDDRSWVSQEVQRAFVAHVREGGGLLAVHSGTLYADVPRMRRLIGGVFIRHPKQCPVTVEPQEGHPLTAGSDPFTEVDEHYFVDLDDAEAEVFLTTRSEHGSQPGGWARHEGKGRVCVFTPGHNVEVWQQQSFQTLLDNALRWCSGALGV